MTEQETKKPLWVSDKHPITGFKMNVSNAQKNAYQKQVKTIKPLK